MPNQEIAHGSLLAGQHPRPDAFTNTQVLLKRDGHRVLCKHFQPGEGLAPHHAPHEVLVVVLSGEMDITVAGSTQPYVAGDYVVFPAGTEHALRCIQAASMLLYL